MSESAIHWFFAVISAGVFLQCVRFLRQRKERRFALFLREFDREEWPVWSRFWIAWHAVVMMVAFAFLLNSLVRILNF